MPDAELAIKALPTFREKLRLAAADCAYVRKDGVNQFHKYNYATAATIFEKVNTALFDHRLMSVPTAEVHELTTRTNAKGGVETLATMKTTLHVHDLDSENIIEVTAFGSGMDNGDKAIMKAQTAALKYAWMTLFNISTGDDPEDDAKVDARQEGISIKAKQGVQPRGIVPPVASQAVPEALLQTVLEPHEEEPVDEERPSIFEEHTPTEVEKLQKALKEYKAGQVKALETECECGAPIVSRESKMGMKYRVCEASAKAYPVKLEGKHHWSKVK